MNERLEVLRARYGSQAIDTGLRLEPSHFLDKLELRDALDPHYAQLWLDYGYGGVASRAGLDLRTRLLVLVGQFVMRREQAALADAIAAALDAEVPVSDVLEVIIQCQLYGGTVVIDPALETFETMARGRGLMEELRSTRLPRDGRDSERSLETERATWDPDDLADPRLAPLLERHGWLGVSAGLRLRPRHHLDILEYFDALDSGFATLWVNLIYRGFYSRGLLDDRTRLLCMVGDCIALNEEVQAGAHMAGAMRAGAAPREILEVILMSSFFIGGPALVNFLRVFVQLMSDQGRLEEIGNPHGPVR